MATEFKAARSFEGNVDVKKDLGDLIATVEKADDRMAVDGSSEEQVTTTNKRGKCRKKRGRVERKAENKSKEERGEED